MFLANFLIALREGLEAALVVSILVAYLVKTGRKEMLRPLWIGVSAAVAIPLLLGAIMTWGPTRLSFQAQEVIGGTLSLVAVGMVTWMILWMGRNSQVLADELRSEVSQALAKGSAMGIVWIAIVAVGREGIETALFVWAVTRSATITSVWEPVVGVVAGLATSVALGWLIYRGSVRINLRWFFLATGGLLILVAAGVTSYGIGDFQEASVLPGWGISAYDLTGLVSANNLGYVLLEAIFNLNLAPTWLQLLGWALYLIIVIPLFISVSRRRQAAPAQTTQAK